MTPSSCCVNRRGSLSLRLVSLPPIHCYKQISATMHFMATLGTLILNARLDSSTLSMETYGGMMAVTVGCLPHSYLCLQVQKMDEISGIWHTAICSCSHPRNGFLALLNLPICPRSSHFCCHQRGSLASQTGERLDSGKAGLSAE